MEYFSFSCGTFQPAAPQAVPSVSVSTAISFDIQKNSLCCAFTRYCRKMWACTKHRSSTKREGEAWHRVIESVPGHDSVQGIQYMGTQGTLERTEEQGDTVNSHCALIKSTFRLGEEDTGAPNRLI